MILDEVEKKLKGIKENIKKKRGIHESVVSRVSDALLEKLSGKKGPPPVKLSKEEVDAVAKTLVIAGVKSPKTWLHRDILNVFIEKLKKAGIIHPETRFFNIPLRIRRYLIVHFREKVWENLHFIRALQEDLNNLKVGKYESLKDEEEDCLCSFIASCIIYGKVLFPGLEKRILVLRMKNISVSPAFIEILLRSSGGREGEAFYRYFLPPPASIFLQRLLLYYQKNRRRLGIRRAGKPDSYLFPSLEERTGKFDALFNRWLIKKLEGLGFDWRASGLTLSSFRKAALMASILDLPGKTGKANPYPPFIISIQTREIESDSVDKKQFMLDSGGGKEGYHGMIYGMEMKKIRRGETDLQSVFNEVSRIIKPLQEGSSMKARRNAAGRIGSLISSSEETLGASNFQNFRLYAEWIMDMLNVKKDNSIKKIDTYSPNVINLLNELHKSKAPIHLLNKDDLTNAIRKTMDMYGSKNVKKGIKSFTEFVESITKRSFTSPNWRSKELQKEDLLFQKPLIYPFHVDEALGKMEEFFTRNARRLKNKDTKAITLKQAEHKCKALFHMINLGFYAGTRASEFANLKVQNVIFDNGFVLCIRASKTDNGVRNIPLSSVLPDDYLRIFITYYKERKAASKNGEELLFPDYSGELIDTSHYASEVSRLFEEIGIDNMRFHHLRHGFANWLLLRWFAAFHPEYAEGMPFLENPLFREPYAVRLKRLFCSDGGAGQESFTYVLAVIARLIGHGGPIVTLQKYIHTVDWLFYMLSRGMEDESVRFTAKQAEVFLQRTYPSLPKELKGRGIKKMKFRDILGLQRRYLKLADKLTL